MAEERWVNRRLNIIPRVVYSLGPFFSSLKRRRRSVGKSSSATSHSLWRAGVVVQMAFRQSKTSCRS